MSIVRPANRSSFRVRATFALVAITVTLVIAVALTATSRALNAPPALSASEPPGRVLVVGDSVAKLTGEGLADVSEEHRLAVTNGGTPGCGFVRGGEVLTQGGWMRVDPACQAWAERWTYLVGVNDPEVVVLLVGFWDVFDRRIGGTILEFGSPEADAYTKRELNAALDALTSRGANVVLLTTPYFAPAPDGASLTARDKERVDHMNELFREVASESAGMVEVRDLNRLLTPGGYRHSIDGVDMRGDGIHLTDAGKEYVADWLAPLVVERIVELRDTAE
jgi:hypothetical protein